MLNLSRSAWIASIGVLVIWLLAFKDAKAKRALGMVFLSIVIVGLFVSGQFLERMKFTDTASKTDILSAENVVEGSDSLLKGRPLYWTIAWELVKDKSWLGHGFGWHNFKPLFKDKFAQTYPDAKWTEAPSHSHSTVLGLLVQGGFLGFSLFSLFTGFLIFQAYRNFVQNRQISYLVFIISFLLGFYGFGLVDDMLLEQEGIYYFAFLGSFIDCPTSTETSV